VGVDAAASGSGAGAGAGSGFAILGAADLAAGFAAGLAAVLTAAVVTFLLVAGSGLAVFAGFSALAVVALETAFCLSPMNPSPAVETGRIGHFKVRRRLCPAVLAGISATV
jgi:hypothetical protein